MKKLARMLEADGWKKMPGKSSGLLELRGVLANVRGAVKVAEEGLGHALDPAHIARHFHDSLDVAVNKLKNII